MGGATTTRGGTTIGGATTTRAPRPATRILAPGARASPRLARSSTLQFVVAPWLPLSFKLTQPQDVLGAFGFGGRAWYGGQTGGGNDYPADYVVKDVVRHHGEEFSTGPAI